MMRNFFDHLIKALHGILEPGAAPLLFLVGAVLLGVISNAAYDFTSSLLGKPGVVFVSAIGALVTLVILYALIPRLFRPRLTITDIAPRAGLIVLVSQGQLDSLAAHTAIKHHLPRLKNCWLITSPKPKPKEDPDQNESQEKPPQPAPQLAWKNAEDLKALYESPTCHLEIVKVDPENPEEIYKKVEQAFRDAQRKYGLPRYEIVADYTGGTKTMTVGMVLACTYNHCDVEYVRPRAFLDDGRADPHAGSDPKQVDLSFWPGATKPEE